MFSELNSYQVVWVVEHMRGVAGIDEEAVDSWFVVPSQECDSPEAAIAKVRPADCQEVNGGSGRYNDYFMASAEFVRRSDIDRVPSDVWHGESAEEAVYLLLEELEDAAAARE